MKQIIALVNRKGGVLIDFDPQGNATTAFGIAKGNNLPTVYDVLIGQSSWKEATRGIIGSGMLGIIPASADLSGAEVELVNTRNREYRLRDRLKGFEASYDFILLDCPPSLGLLTVNALAAAHGVMIPIQCEFYALEGLSQVLNTMEIIKKSINRSLDMEGILLTMYDQHSSSNQAIEQKVRHLFPKHTFATVIPRDAILSEAPAMGRPGVWYHPWSQGAQAYIQLTLEMQD
ncbi:MAG: AAA family ATPase [Magnetococcus sp. YQC-9]